jgi:hypothetical protein
MLDGGINNKHLLKTFKVKLKATANENKNN